MNQSYGMQRAASAYKNAAVNNYSDEDLWGRSVAFMVIKLKEAQRHRKDGNFEGTCACHDRIQRITAVLHSSLPTAIDDDNIDVKMASNRISEVYYDIQRSLAAVTAKDSESADAIYTRLIGTLQELQAKLKIATQQAPTSIAYQNAQLPADAQ